jgi:hypothetical protein
MNNLVFIIFQLRRDLLARETIIEENPHKLWTNYCTKVPK